MIERPNYDQELDTSGLSCPLPILKTKKALVTMEVGERIYVVATDPGSLPDFQAFAEQTGHALLRADESDGRFHFVLEKVARKTA